MSFTLRVLVLICCFYPFVVYLVAAGMSVQIIRKFSMQLYI